MIRTKSEKEIEILKEGGKRHAQILQALKEKVSPGVSTFALEEYARELVAQGGDKGAFLHYKPAGAKRPYPAVLCVSVNDAIVHGIPNEEEYILKSGDIVSLDLGLTHKNLITDSAITVGVGSITEKEKQLLYDNKEALYKGIEQAIVGNRIGDISYAIGSFARKKGYGMAEGLAGHGVGFMVHEDPYVPNEGKKGTGEILRPGMVLAIEPMLTLGGDAIILARDGYTYKTKDGSKASHFEHTIVITEEGPIILTE
jgi:methionyl aminopeptidase